MVSVHVSCLLIEVLTEQTRLEGSAEQRQRSPTSYITNKPHFAVDTFKGFNCKCVVTAVLKYGRCYRDILYIIKLLIVDIASSIF